MSDERSTFTVDPEALGHLRRGDLITFSAAPERWWKRLWRWLSRRPKPPLKLFMITGMTTSTAYFRLPMPDPHELARRIGQTIGPDAVVEQRVEQDPVVLVIDGYTYATERVITRVQDMREWRDLSINFGWVHIGEPMPSGTYEPQL